MLSAELKAEADNTYRDLDCDYYKTQFDIVLGNHALRAQPTDESLICQHITT